MPAFVRDPYGLIEFGDSVPEGAWNLSTRFGGSSQHH